MLMIPFVGIASFVAMLVLAFRSTSARWVYLSAFGVTLLTAGWFAANKARLAGEAVFSLFTAFNMAMDYSVIACITLMTAIVVASLRRP